MSRVLFRLKASAFPIVIQKFRLFRLKESLLPIASQGIFVIFIFLKVWPPDLLILF